MSAIEAAEHRIEELTTQRDRLLAEVEDLKRLLTPEGLKIQSVNYAQWEAATSAMELMKTELQAAADALKPPFLALPEQFTSEMLAYRRGARDAYLAVVRAFKELKR